MASAKEVVGYTLDLTEHEADALIAFIGQTSKKSRNDELSKNGYAPLTDEQNDALYKIYAALHYVKEYGV